VTMEGVKRRTLLFIEIVVAMAAVIVAS